MPDRPLVYIDTSVIVALLLGEEGADEAVAAFDSIEAGAAYCVVSPLVLAEAFGAFKIRGTDRSGLSRTRGRRIAIDAIAQVREQFIRMEAWENCIMVENTRRHAYMVESFGFKYQLKGPDALHLATAVDSKCEYLFTLDRQLLNVAGQEGVLVERPRGLGALSSDADGISMPSDLPGALTGDLFDLFEEESDSRA